MDRASFKLGDRNSKGRAFQMTILGYEFPNLEYQPFDADWLKVSFQVNHPRGSWTKTDPCLLTWELDELQNWFRSIADNQPDYLNIDFMEPELRFEWIGQKNTLRIHLSYSLRPHWSPYIGPHAEQDLYIDFVVSPEILRDVAAALGKEVKKYPVRVKV